MIPMWHINIQQIEEHLEISSECCSFNLQRKTTWTPQKQGFSLVEEHVIWENESCNRNAYYDGHTFPTVITTWAQNSKHRAQHLESQRNLNTTYIKISNMISNLAKNTTWWLFMDLYINRFFSPHNWNLKNYLACSLWLQKRLGQCMESFISGTSTPREVPTSTTSSLHSEESGQAASHLDSSFG